MESSLIKVKEIKEKSREGKTWLEIKDTDDRLHSIFHRVQDQAGSWHDLSAKYEMLSRSEGRSLRIFCEKKGKFINILDVEAVEEEPSAAVEKTPEVTGMERRLETFTVSYAKDLAVAGKIAPENILAWSELLARYLNGELSISEAKLKLLHKAQDLV
jgi:hypothetical protein